MAKSSINRIFFLFVGLIILNSCQEKTTLFNQLDASATGIRFVNHNEDTDTLNVFDYLYYYNGAGVAVGDINNDGLPDIYFVANQGGNKLYLNKGGFKFEDITDKAGVKGNADWSTGVTMADVNGDGWLDIYVCTVGNHVPWSGGRDSSTPFFPHSKNQLFINNRDGTFTESAAAYGIDITGYSTQAVFFDYDKDGDLDMFLLQHSKHQTASYGDTSLRRKYSEVSGCKLFRNDDNHFSNVTKESHLLSSALGYGLGLAVADFNNDGWDDIYVGNDFHENDYYYINNKDGTFSEQNATAFGHESLFSMGNDAVDFNNDGHTDLITLDMLPEDETEIKRSIGEESFDEYVNLHGKLGYHYQYSHNCLQINTDNGQRFAETALYSGVAATDWSWCVLGADFNLDGNKDIFITNGIKRRINDLDFIRYRSSEAIEVNPANIRAHDAELFKHIPEAAWHNYMFLNDGNLQFNDASEQYGFTQPTLSNGCAYADLDNDGDLDLVINNMNAPAGIFRNDATETASKNYLTIQFNGSAKNRFGIGTKLYAFANKKLQYQEVQTTRGYMSSVAPLLNFGFGSTASIDSIIIIWPDEHLQRITNVTTNQRLIVNYADAKDTIKDHSLFVEQLLNNKPATLFTDITTEANLNWKHNENLSFNDFNRNPFIPHQLSTLGPALAVADVNGDKLEDIFIGGAKNQPAALFMQDAGGRFSLSAQLDIEKDSLCEDVKAIFFDADNDGDKDLYVASGGGEFHGDAAALADRLYINDGKGHFTKSTAFPLLYENKGAIAIDDYDKDGDADIFVGGRANTLNYGDTPKSWLLNNDGKGNFTVVTQTVEGLERVGMVSSAAWKDLDNDGYPELIIAGEWMAPVIYQNKKGKLVKFNNHLVNSLTGLWQSDYITDVNGDGRPDILLGNYGLNSKLTASEKYPLKLFCKDFDNNQNVDQILAIAKNEKYYTFLGKETLENQLPFIKKDFLSYKKMAGKTVEEIFGNKLDGSHILTANTLASVALINRGNLVFDTIQMPQAFQWMPLFAFAQKTDQSIIAGGNFYGVLPFEGRYDNAMLPVMRFDNNTVAQTGLAQTEGEVRDMQWINMANKKRALVIARNNMKVELFMEK